MRDAAEANDSFCKSQLKNYSDILREANLPIDRVRMKGLSR